MLGFTAALYARDYEAAIAHLEAWPDDAWRDTRYVSKAASYGIAHELAGREAQARAHFEQAGEEIAAELERDAEIPALLVALGESLAGLGRDVEANEAARRALTLYRDSHDALDVPELELDAALRVFVHTGAVDAALSPFGASLGAPGLWSIEGLLPDPRLDPIRDDPRFVALVEKYERR